MNDIELCQELMTRAEEYQKQKEREFAIAELEKLKTKIEKEKEPYIKMWETGFDDVSYGKYRAYNKMIDFIMKRIDELREE